MGLLADIRKENKIRRDRHERMEIKENKIKRNFNSSEKYKKLLTDITTIKEKGNKLYLFVIKDLFDNETIKYKLSKRCDLDLVFEGIKEIIKEGKITTDTIIHSDRGFQYTHPYYAKLLKENGIIQSMSRKGEPLDNAPVESFFGHLKSELIHLFEFETEEQLRRGIKKYIKDYNNKRSQAVLNHLTPVEFKNKYANTT